MTFRGPSLNMVSAHGWLPADEANLNISPASRSSLSCPSILSIKGRVRVIGRRGRLASLLTQRHHSIRLDWTSTSTIRTCIAPTGSRSRRRKQHRRRWLTNKLCACIRRDATRLVWIARAAAVIWSIHSTTSDPSRSSNTASTPHVCLHVRTSRFHAPLPGTSLQL